MPKIETLYAYIIADRDDDDEGVPAVGIDGTIYPLMGADLDRAKSFEVLAQQLADKQGKPIRLVRSTGIEIVKVINPRAPSHD